MPVIDDLLRIYQAIEREARAAGPGTLTRMQEAAGVGKNYLCQLRLRLESGQEKSCDLVFLLRALDFLGLDKVDFFTDLFGLPNPIERLRAETARSGEPPEVVIRVRQLQAVGDCEPPPESSPGAPGAAALALPVEIQKLDDHRFHDPRQTLELVADALNFVEAGVAPPWTAVLLLAVWGSARRMVFDRPNTLDEAQQALIAAYEIAESWGAGAILGDLSQRLGYIVADRGDRQRALILTDLAIVQHATGGHRRGIARALVDRGVWLYYLGQPRQAIEAQKAALEQLPEDEQRNRFSAFQNLGLCYQELGEPERAKRYAKLAEEISGGLGDFLRGKLLWLQAGINIDCAELGKAEHYLEDVIAVFYSIHPIESAVATTDLVRLQLRDGRPADAHETARSAVHLAGALKKNRIAAAAIEELTCCGFAGRDLTIASVDDLARRIQKGWERQRRRSRRKR